MDDHREQVDGGFAPDSNARRAAEAIAQIEGTAGTGEEMHLIVFVPEDGWHADVVLQVLRDTTLGLEVTSDEDELIGAMSKGIAAVLLGEESLNAALLDRIEAVSLAEPVWSSLPMIVISGGDRLAREQLALTLREAGIDFVTVLRRPVNTEALLVAVYSAIRARELQYRIRDSLLQGDELAEIAPAARDESGEELLTSYDTAPVALCLLDRELRYLRVNQRMADLNGVPVARHIGRRVEEIVPDLAPAAADSLEAVLSTGEAKLDQDFVGKTAAHPGQSRTWVEQWYPLRSSRGSIVGVNVIAQDVTDERQAREALEWSYRFEQQLTERLEALVERYRGQIREQKGELRRLALALSDAEYDERRRISEQLHGGLQQTVASLRLQLQLYAEEQGWTLPKFITQLLEEAMDISRSVASDVNSAAIPGSRFCDELGWLVTWAKQRYAIDLECSCEEAGPEPDPSDRLFLMQCLRELLLNVFKHAAIGSASLSVEEEDRGINVRFEDEGIGFDAVAVDQRIENGGKSFGLASIRGRASALGWKFDIESRPGAGTRAFFYIPNLPATKN